LSLTPEEHAAHSPGQAQKSGKKGLFAKVAFSVNSIRRILQENILFSKELRVNDGIRMGSNSLMP
jgi:hypothetical protein